MNYTFRSESTGTMKKLVMIEHPASTDRSDCYMIESLPNGKELKKSQFSGPHDFEEALQDLTGDPDWTFQSMSP